MRRQKKMWKTKQYRKTCMEDELSGNHQFEPRYDSKFPKFFNYSKIEGANFQQLQIWQKQIFGHPSIFRAVRWRDIHFVIPRPTEARKLKREKIDEALRLELDYVTKGFISKKLVDLEWKEGRLADLLNRADLRSRLLEEKKREFSKKGKVTEANDLRIGDDKGYGCVRIYLPMDEDESSSNSKIIAKTLAYLKICDEIAGIIRKLFVSEDL